jgi:hypothetical protein
MDDLASIYAKLVDMASWPENWNTYKALPINPNAIARAKNWVTEVYQHCPDIEEPNVVGDAADGGVVFEWRNGIRGLTIYVCSDTIDYLKSWGANMSTEMEDGDIQDIGDFLDLRLWLIDGHAKFVEMAREAMEEAL